MDEAKLLARLRQRDEQALELAIRQYTAYLATVLYRAAGGALSPEDTEEIMADVFVGLWTHADRIDLTRGTMRSYMAAMARNLARKRLAKVRPSLPLDQLTLTAEPPADMSPGEDLWAAVMSLGEPDAELFVRYYRYGQSLREIAGATGLKLSTVKSKLSRGRKKLKTRLSDAEGAL